MKADDARLTAFMFDELPAEDAASLQSALKDDPALEMELASMEEFSSQLNRAFKQGCETQLGEDHWTEIEAAANPTPELLTFVRPRKTKSIPWLPLAAGIMIGAVLAFFALNRSPETAPLIAKQSAASSALVIEESSTPLPENSATHVATATEPLVAHETVFPKKKAASPLLSQVTPSINSNVSPEPQIANTLPVPAPSSVTAPKAPDFAFQPVDEPAMVPEVPDSTTPASPLIFPRRVIGSTGNETPKQPIEPPLGLPRLTPDRTSASPSAIVTLPKTDGPKTAANPLQKSEPNASATTIAAISPFPGDLDQLQPGAPIPNWLQPDEIIGLTPLGPMVTLSTIQDPAWKIEATILGTTAIGYGDIYYLSATGETTASLLHPSTSSDPMTLSTSASSDASSSLNQDTKFTLDVVPPTPANP